MDIMQQQCLGCNAPLPPAHFGSASIGETIKTYRTTYYLNINAPDVTPAIWPDGKRPEPMSNELRNRLGL